MSIVSLRFFVFVAILLAVYWVISRRLRWVVLFAGSILFILFSTEFRPLLLAIFAAETLLVWLVALWMSKCRTERGKTTLSGVTIGILLVVLVFFKEFSFFVDNINAIGRALGDNPRLKMHGFTAPFGISYYTLILIGYLLDVRWGTISEPQRNPLKMLLFTGWFPQLTSGPFSRYRDTSDALFESSAWDLRRTQFGLQRMLWGLFKKLVLAERFAVLVAGIFDSTTTGEGLLVPIGAFLYVTQVYMDFSGCMDIVIGVSEMFGVSLAENFARPFSSTSLSEIWRRWHMTLGFWLKDYLLYPVQKSRLMTRIRNFAKKHWGKKASREIPTYLGMLVTWFCVGFWHGGSWKYIFGSGLFFFIMIAAGMLLKPVFAKLTALLRIDTETWSWQLFGRARSFCLFAFAISFNRWKDLAAGFKAWKTLFTVRNPWVLVDNTILKLGLDRPDFDVCVLGLLVVLIVSMLQEKHGSVRELLEKQNLVFRWIVYLSLFFAVLLLGWYGPGYDPAAFIYERF